MPPGSCNGRRQVSLAPAPGVYRAAFDRSTFQIFASTCCAPQYSVRPSGDATMLHKSSGGSGSVTAISRRSSDVMFCVTSFPLVVK